MYSRQIESFVETAKAGSFNKAAKLLYIAPSSLIQQIDLLERRLGITLFERGNRGVKLTEAGASLYRDAVDIMRHSDEAVARAVQIQEGDRPIRVATSLLMKCRMLPSIWSHMIEDVPDTRIDIISLESAGVEPGNYLRGLGISYDVMEGLFMSELYEDQCLFLELRRAPLCLAMPKSLEVSNREVVDEEMLRNLDLVMMRTGRSTDYDAAHSYLCSLGANCITEVPFYTMELFTDCELNRRAIVTTEIWEDVHPNLVCIPFAEPHTMPYGLIFPNNPTGQVLKLYQMAKRMSEGSSSPVHNESTSDFY